MFRVADVVQTHFFIFVYTCGLMAVCCVAYGYAQTHLCKKVLRRSVVGISFGLAGVLAMMQPMELEAGYQG